MSAVTANQPDLLVIGAGPAGMSAATMAADLGLDVDLIDETQTPGGQVYRAAPPGLSPTTPTADHIAGDKLREALSKSTANYRGGTRVWFTAPDLTVAGTGPQGPLTWTPRAIIVASGTTERIVPVPGVTLPGVVGLAGATILLKAHQALPGERTVVAGAGPLLAAVAAGIIKGGGGVAAIIDLATRGEWMGKLPSMAGRPDLLRQGLQWRQLIRKANVPYLYGHTVTNVIGEDAVEAVEVAAVDKDGRKDGASQTRRFDCDALAIGHGLVPTTDLSRLFGAAHDYRQGSGGWVVRVDADLQTTVPGLFAAGDVTGISGAAAAAIEGELAALAAACHLGLIDSNAFKTQAAPIRTRLARARRFGAAMASLMAMRDGLIDQATPETVICRCEDIARADIDAAVAAGVRSLNQLKTALRCGMGPCQGRICGEATAAIIARGARSDRTTVGQWTARAPVRPIPLADLVGDYTYEDIPTPPPAPA